MEPDEFLLITNPDPTKQSFRIERSIYEVVREAILENLHEYGPMTFTRLGKLVEDQLRQDLDDSVEWYYPIVKMDMEVRGELRRAPTFNQQWA